MNPNAIATLAIVLLMLGGCATEPVATSEPDWVQGESAEYPSSQFLTGRGQAAAQEDARDRARADLAKIFEVEITVSGEDVQRFKTDVGGAGAGQYTGQSERRISTRTAQIIRGIQIVDAWHDSVTQVFHALAVLPRLQTMASLRQQLNELDDATRNHIEQSQKHIDLFLKIAAARRAIDAQLERQGLQKSLQVLDPTGLAPPSPWELARLNADLDEIVKRVRVASQVSVDSPQGLGNVVAGALANAGFMIETGQKPDFLLQARLNLEDLGFQDGWYWQRGNLEIILSEAASGRVRGSRTWPVKTSAQDTKSAVKRALEQADAILRKELGSAIMSMAGSQ